MSGWPRMPRGSQEDVWNVSGMSLECVWNVSGRWLGGVWRLSGGYLEYVWRVSRRQECHEDVWKVS